MKLVRAPKIFKQNKESNPDSSDTQYVDSGDNVDDIINMTPAELDAGTIRLLQAQMRTNRFLKSIKRFLIAILICLILLLLIS